eukprot:2756143-Amphidinium_carterae.1
MAGFDRATQASLGPPHHAQIRKFVTVSQPKSSGRWLRVSQESFLRHAVYQFPCDRVSFGLGTVWGVGASRGYDVEL